LRLFCVLALQILTAFFSPFWRTEERQAYEILALHLRRKASLLTATSLDALLSLCGLDLKDPSRSVVANTLATQHVLLDFRIWSGVANEWQRTHLSKIEELVITASANEYNLRKLGKLRTLFSLFFLLFLLVLT
jgi:hypothetical protein